MIRKLIAAVALTTLFVGPSLAADPIARAWLRPSTGVIVKFTPCGAAFCAIVQTGKFAGQSAGSMTATGGGNYKGTLTDLEKKKTYSGKGRLSGDNLNLKGCVLGGLICIGEVWKGQ